MSDRPHDFMQSLSLRASGHVCRWHTIRTISRQTVAEHSGQALTLLLTLHPSPSLNLIKATLWHDSAERRVGDVPAPIRRESLDLSLSYERAETRVMIEDHPVAAEALMNLDADGLRWLKAIDTLELLLHCDEETKLGNAEFRVIYDRARTYLLGDDKTPQTVVEFVSWYEAHGRKESFA